MKRCNGVHDNFDRGPRLTTWLTPQTAARQETSSHDRQARRKEPDFGLKEIRRLSGHRRGKVWESVNGADAR